MNGQRPGSRGRGHKARDSVDHPVSRIRESAEGQRHDLLYGGTDSFIVGPQSTEKNERPVGSSVMALKAGVHVRF